MEAAGTLRQLTRQIRDPRDYYEGACPTGASLPFNILLFSRLNGTLLHGSNDEPFLHGRHVLLANLAREGEIAVDGQWHHLRPGHALLIFPYQIHAFAVPENAALCWLFLTFALAAPEGLGSLRDRTIPLSSLAIRQLVEIAREWRRSAPSPRLCFLTGLLLEEMKSARGRPARKKSQPAPSAESPLSKTLLAQITAHPGSRIKDLAHSCHLSESHLRAKFRRETGLSLGRYLRRIRLQQSAALLASTRLSINEIASRCGFDSIYAFSRSFKSAAGKSPRAFRKAEDHVARLAHKPKN